MSAEGDRPSVWVDAEGNPAERPTLAELGALAEQTIVDAFAAALARRPNPDPGGDP